MIKMFWTHQLRDEMQEVPNTTAEEFDSMYNVSISKNTRRLIQKTKS